MCVVCVRMFVSKGDGRVGREKGRGGGEKREGRRERGERGRYCEWSQICCTQHPSNQSHLQSCKSRVKVSTRVAEQDMHGVPPASDSLLLSQGHS